jgi:hypothetical protein
MPAHMAPSATERTNTNTTYSSAPHQPTNSAEKFELPYDKLIIAVGAYSQSISLVLAPQDGLLMPLPQLSTFLG